MREPARPLRVRSSAASAVYKGQAVARVFGKHPAGCPDRYRRGRELGHDKGDGVERLNGGEGVGEDAGDGDGGIGEGRGRRVPNARPNHEASDTNLRAHETVLELVRRLLREKKKEDCSEQ